MRVGILLGLALGAMCVRTTAAPAQTNSFGGEPASTGEIRSALVGKTVKLKSIPSDAGQITYEPDGTYKFMINGKTFTGHYTISDGNICIDFGHGRSRCDSILVKGNSIIMVNRQHQAYQMMPQ